MSCAGNWASLFSHIRDHVLLLGVLLEMLQGGPEANLLRTFPCWEMCLTPTAHYSFSGKVIKIMATLGFTLLTLCQALYHAHNINYFMSSKQQCYESDTVVISFYKSGIGVQRVFNLPAAIRQSWDANTSLSYLHFSALFTWVPVCTLVQCLCCQARHSLVIYC